jgi:hypothetical protein
MRLIRLALLLGALGAPCLLAPSAARANIIYPWCAIYGKDMGGASNCGFSTWQQCMATVSGIGGSCEPNQFYRPPQPAVRKRKRPPR